MNNESDAQCVMIWFQIENKNSRSSLLYCACEKKTYFAPLSFLAVAAFLLFLLELLHTSKAAFTVESVEDQRYCSMFMN